MTIQDDVSRNLEKAEAILQCVLLGLEYGEGNLAKAPDYGLVIKMACDLVRGSITKLNP